MVIGVPNVGKSSLINALRRTNLKKGKLWKLDICTCLFILCFQELFVLKLKNKMDISFLNTGKASRVGGEPGITKAVLTKIQVF